MKNKRRLFMAMALGMAIYMQYLIGCIGIAAHPAIAQRRVLPFYVLMTASDIGILLDVSLLIFLVSLAAWAFTSRR